MKKLSVFLVILFSFVLLVGCNNNTPQETEPEKEPTYVYASSIGTGDGSFENPCSLKVALTKFSQDSPICLFGGLYEVDSTITFNKSGTAQNNYKIMAYKNQSVVLDFGYHLGETAKIDSTSLDARYSGIILSGSYYHISGITITGAGCCGMYISGHYNTIENCVFAENCNSGLQVSGSSSKTITDWPHNNTIKNCTSYGNYDWNRNDGRQGEDADGFACKITAGENNVFDGCVAYNNSDDGWDLFTKYKTGAIGKVKIRNCIAFNNGYGLDGTELKNGNGFKLGGRTIEVDHYLYNCMAFNNKGNGFDDNSNPGKISFHNCTAYNNQGRNFATGRFPNDNNTYSSTWTEDGTSFGPIYNVPKSHNVYSFCISYQSGAQDAYVGIAEYSLLVVKSGTYERFSSVEKCNYKEVDSERKINKTNCPFEEVTSDIFSNSNLKRVHAKIRDENGNIKTGDFLKVTAEFLAYGNNGNRQIGCNFD